MWGRVQTRVEVGRKRKINHRKLFKDGREPSVCLATTAAHNMTCIQGQTIMSKHRGRFRNDCPQASANIARHQKTYIDLVDCQDLASHHKHP
ncbi:hypothetical protein RRG08_023866 [Elysia crispata]|uniref:Uncharacterized protein n=1 Tax=Elysia crispata TaxID=231223 RepID=A0AAE1ATM2_9GAST|nr:hypothetical protein RRG08_023866 [Elysia crispata]